jgi:16S rRNA (cytosine1402-N4)-methyltransferase
MAAPSYHEPVLFKEVVDGLSPKEGETVVDATLGHGGHALLLGERLGKDGTLIGFELDPEALLVSRERLSELLCKKIFLGESYRNMTQMLAGEGITAVNAILFDLGIGSHQLGASGRGFSFQVDEPLSMRFDAGTGLSARDLLRAATVEDLTSIIGGYGGEKYAKRIAEAIIRERQIEPIESTKRLHDIVWQTVPPWARHGRINPATKTFQALRMAVNDELATVTEGISQAFRLLAPGGRLAVISFHSLEDGIVKRFFKEKKERGEGEVYYKKPVTATSLEISNNPRSRSAKLRIIKKI